MCGCHLTSVTEALASVERGVGTEPEPIGNHFPATRMSVATDGWGRKDSTSKTANRKLAPPIQSSLPRGVRGALPMADHSQCKARVGLPMRDTREGPLAHDQTSAGLVPAGSRLTATQTTTHPFTPPRDSLPWSGDRRQRHDCGPLQSLAPPTQGRWRPPQFRLAVSCQSWLRSGKPSGGRSKERQRAVGLK